MVIMQGFAIFVQYLAMDNTCQVTFGDNSMALTAEKGQNSSF